MENEKPDLSRAAQRFLASGNMSRLAPAALAEACETLILLKSRQSLTKALALARVFVKRTAAQPTSLRLAAYRSFARAAHLGARHREALHAYLNARQLQRGNTLGVAKVDRALIDIYMYLGDFAESRRRALLALRAFKNAQADSDVAMTQVNLANMLHRQDRHRDAEKLYRSAAEHFRRIANAPALARCLYNRANTLVQLFRMNEAELLYDESERIYTENGFTLEATDARYGLAWLRMLSGQFHVALTDLAECESIYRQLVPFQLISPK